MQEDQELEKRSNKGADMLTMLDEAAKESGKSKQVRNPLKLTTRD
ncbi:unnamed protein product [Enterobius vermicularis]|uniref:DNA-binding protein n=1 Tax=Enterobius vermicularis TaxID=51028 RepID=A0A0N4VIL4_ENTVE|nr:unnamed protein product [Enterobius vermicularis]